MFNLLAELKSRQGDPPEFALRLWLVAFVLLVVFAATVLNAALPLRLLDPRWLQGLIQVLLSQGFLPLMALVLLQLAAVLNPESGRLRRRGDRCSRLALVTALGFVLLIPLQLVATWGSLNHQDLARRLTALPIPQSGSGSAADLALPLSLIHI